MPMIEEFAEIYGMRFTGLVDPSNSVYAAYNYPNAEAPYPRDIVIDADGRVRYWSTEYDPQKIIEVIAGLLDSPASLGPAPAGGRISLAWDPVWPNPSPAGVRVRWSSPLGGWSLELFDPSGRRIRNLGRFADPGEHRLDWDGRDREGRPLPAGVYFLRLRNGARVESQRIMRID